MYILYIKGHQSCFPSGFRDMLQSEWLKIFIDIGLLNSKNLPIVPETKSDPFCQDQNSHQFLR